MKGGLYMRMKLRGIDMGWYERGKKAIGEAIPLEDQECSNGSIYLMKDDGTVWTLSSKGAAHKQVRDTGKQLPEQIYVCMHTKVAYGDLNEAMQHKECKDSKEVM